FVDQRGGSRRRVKEDENAPRRDHSSSASLTKRAGTWCQVPAPETRAARSGLALEVQPEPDLQHARRDDFLRPAEVRRRPPRRVERRLAREGLREVADAVLHGARVERVVQLEDDRGAVAAEADALVGAQRQQVEEAIAVGAALLDRDAARALRQRNRQRAIARQAAQRLVVGADVDAPRRLVAAEDLERVRLIVGAAAEADIVD